LARALAISLLCVAAAAAAACGSAGRERAGWRLVSAPIHSERGGKLVANARLTARLPPGWRVTRHRLSGLISPGEVMAVASYPIRHIDAHTNCTPRTLIEELPLRGVAIWILENFNGHDHWLNAKGRAFFPRRQRFTLSREQFRGYECMGLSWAENFRDRGRGFYVSVYGHPAHLPAAVKRQTLRVLDSLRVRRLRPSSSS
jgi:hypothetical protein